MSTEPTAHEHVRALAIAVRDGELAPEQREALVDLLRSLGTAVTLAARDHHSDSDAATLGYLIAAWGPVASAYAELAATLASCGEGRAPCGLAGYPSLRYALRGWLCATGGHPCPGGLGFTACRLCSAGQAYGMACDCKRDAESNAAETVSQDPPTKSNMRVFDLRRSASDRLCLPRSAHWHLVPGRSAGATT